MHIKYSFPSSNRTDAHHLKCWTTHWNKYWQRNTSTLAQGWNLLILSCIHSFSAVASHGCYPVTSWYIHPSSSSLLQHFWFHHHLSIYLYKLHNSANDSQFSWRGNYYYSIYKQQICCTPLCIRYQLVLIASTFYICITLRK